MWSELTKKELAILRKLSTPKKIQDFLDTIPRNLEENGDTCMCPRRVLQEKKAHCIEGAMLAALALWIHGEKPLLLDLRANSKDQDHVVALYKLNGYWGAISKTNHATLRFRDPIYKTVRELALSYFHEYFINETGQKSLRAYSNPFDLRTFGKAWITNDEEVFDMVLALDDSPHHSLVPKKNERHLRKADKMEIKAGSLVEWN